MTAIAAVELDVQGVAATDSGALWDRTIGDGHRPLPPVIHLRPREVTRSRDVGDLQLADADDLGAGDALTGSDQRATTRDVVVVLPGAPRGEWSAERASTRTLTVPRTVLVAAGCDANLPSPLVLEHDRPLVGVLLMVLDEAWNRVSAMTASEVEATRGALVTLAAGAIRAGRGGVTARAGLPALRARIEAWIDNNLRSGPIHIEALAAAHSVSARTVHRAFSLTGETMTAVVRARRLAAVREDLVHTDLTIAAIAHRWSYYDPSHLGREFRRHFGISPSEYRESHGC